MSNLSWGMRFLPLRFCALAQNLVKIKSKKPYKSFCYFLLSQKVESFLPYRLQSTKKGKFADSTLDSTIPQNLTESSKKSALDSAKLQNLTRKAQNPRISHAVRKSFCYFWLSPKVESLLPYQPQSTKRRKFVESFAESALPLPSNSPDSFRKKGCTPLHSPPTRQKAAAFSLLGGVPRFSVSSKKSAGGTSAPLIPDFLHHETGEFSGATHDLKLDSTQSVESKKSFCYFLLLQKVESPLPYRLQTTKKGNFAESHAVRVPCLYQIATESAQQILS